MPKQQRDTEPEMTIEVDEGKVSIHVSGEWPIINWPVNADDPGKDFKRVPTKRRDKRA